MELFYHKSQRKLLFVLPIQPFRGWCSIRWGVHSVNHTPYRHAYPVSQFLLPLNIPTSPRLTADGHIECYLYKWYDTWEFFYYFLGDFLLHFLHWSLLFFNGNDSNESGTYFSIEYDDVFFKLFITSVADPNPDPSNPYVFGPPGSGSISQQVQYGIWIRILLSSSKNRKKNLASYCFVTSFWLFIFEKLYKCTFKKW